MNQPAQTQQYPDGGVTATTLNKSLGDVALALLTGDGKFTDLHFESGKPVKSRRSARDWAQVRVPTGQGDATAPLYVTHREIIEFLNGVFSEEPAEEALAAYLAEEMAESPAGVLELAQRGAKFLASRVAGNKSESWMQRLHREKQLHPATNLNEEKKDGGLISQRVRCTVQLQGMGHDIGLVIRPLHAIPENLEKIGVGVASNKMMTGTSGLIVVTGPTGSGKSTTLAAMINMFNHDKERELNIYTIEDPIEFEHKRHKAIINQREVGVDVATFEDGVATALRFVPDVLLIGEIRTAETMLAALRAAESGILVLTTLHAPTAFGAIRKMIAYLDPSQVPTLASCLLGVIAQALVRDVDAAKGNHLACEILNCRDEKVIGAIAGAVTEEGVGKLKALDSEFRKSWVKPENLGVPMLTSLAAMVNSRAVDKARAQAACFDADDRATLLKMDAPAGSPAPAQPVAAQAGFNPSATGRFNAGGVKKG